MLSRLLSFYLSFPNFYQLVLSHTSKRCSISISMPGDVFLGTRIFRSYTLHYQKPSLAQLFRFVQLGRQIFARCLWGCDFALWISKSVITTLWAMLEISLWGLDHIMATRWKQIGHRLGLSPSCQSRIWRTLWAPCLSALASQLHNALLGKWEKIFLRVCYVIADIAFLIIEE